MKQKQKINVKKEEFILKEHKSKAGVVHTYYQSNLRKDKYQKKYLFK
jgi:hypothetical protein